MKHVSILSKLWYKISCNTETGIQKKLLNLSLKRNNTQTNKQLDGGGKKIELIKFLFISNFTNK